MLTYFFPPLNLHFTHGRYNLPNLNLLVEVCSLQHQLSCLKAKGDAQQHLEDRQRTRKVPTTHPYLTSLATPLPILAPNNCYRWPFKRDELQNPPPSLVSSIYGDDILYDSHNEDHTDVDDEASIVSLDGSQYPLPHTNPAVHTSIIRCKNGYNLPYTLDFDPNKIRTHSSN